MSDENQEIVKSITNDIKRTIHRLNNEYDKNIHTLLKKEIHGDGKFSGKTFEEIAKDSDFQIGDPPDKIKKKYLYSKLYFLTNLHLHRLIGQQNQQTNLHLHRLIGQQNQQTYPLFDFILEKLQNIYEQIKPEENTVQSGQSGGNLSNYDLDTIIKKARGQKEEPLEPRELSSMCEEESNTDTTTTENRYIENLIDLLSILYEISNITIFTKTKINICEEIEKYNKINDEYKKYIDKHGFDISIIYNDYEDNTFLQGEHVLYNNKMMMYINKINIDNKGKQKFELNRKKGDTKHITVNDIRQLKKVPLKKLYDYFQVLELYQVEFPKYEDGRLINAHKIKLYLAFAKRLYELVRHVFTLTNFERFIQKYNPAQEHIHKEDFEFTFIDYYDTHDTHDTQQLNHNISTINRKFSEFIEIHFGEFNVSNDPIRMLFLYTYHGMNFITKQEREYSSKYKKLNPINPFLTHIQPIGEEKEQSNVHLPTQEGGLPTLKNSLKGVNKATSNIRYVGERMTKGTYDFLWSYNERKNKMYHKNVEYKLFVLLDALYIFKDEISYKKYLTYFKLQNKKQIQKDDVFELKEKIQFLPSNLSQLNSGKFHFQNKFLENDSEYFIEKAILSFSLPKKEIAYIPIKYNKLINDSSSHVHVTLFENRYIKVHAKISKKNIVECKRSFIPGSRPLPKILRGMYDIIQTGQKTFNFIDNTDNEKRMSVIIYNLREYLKNKINKSNQTGIIIRTEIKKHIGNFIDVNENSELLSLLNSLYLTSRDAKVDKLYNELLKVKPTTNKGIFTRRKRELKDVRVTSKKNHTRQKYFGLTATAVAGIIAYNSKDPSSGIQLIDLASQLSSIPKGIVDFSQILGQGISSSSGTLITGIAASPIIFQIYIGGVAVYLSVSAYKAYMKWKSECMYEYTSTVDEVLIEVEYSHNLLTTFKSATPCIKNVIPDGVDTQKRVVNINIYDILTEYNWRSIISVDLEYVYINETLEIIMNRLGFRNLQPQMCTGYINLPKTDNHLHNDTANVQINVPVGHIIYLLSYENNTWRWERYSGEHYTSFTEFGKEVNAIFLQKDPFSEKKYSFFNKLNSIVNLFRTVQSLQYQENYQRDYHIEKVDTTRFSNYLKTITNRHLYA